MSTPFEHDEHRDDHAPRIPEEEQGIDALLRAGGEQWRAEVPAVHFDQPSTRVAMLSRGHRAVLTIGIAAAVVAIVLAGSALIGRPAASVGPEAPTSSSSAVPTPINSAAASTLNSVRTSMQLSVTFPPPSSAPADVTRFTEAQRSGRLVSTDVDPSKASMIFGATLFPPVDSDVWSGWDVGTGHLLVGVKDGNCASTFNGLRLADLHRLTLQVVRDTSDVGCDRGWSIASFTPPSGFDPWIASTLVTPLGAADIPPISGVVQNPSKGEDHAGITASQVDGSTSGMISVRWDSPALILDLPESCARSVVGISSDDAGANLRIVGTATGCVEGPGGAGRVSVSVTAPPRSEQEFTVTVAGRTFRVPAVLLSWGGGLPDTPSQWVVLPSAVGKDLAVSRVGRTRDAVMFERACPGNRTMSFKGVQPHQTADQTVVLRQGGQGEGCTSGGPEPSALRSIYVLQPGTDPTKPLTIVLGDNAIQLPPVK